MPGRRVFCHSSHRTPWIRLRPLLSSRHSSTSNDSSHYAFDRKIKWLQRQGAARAQQAWREANGGGGGGGKSEEIVEYDYFRQEIASRLVDRLDDIKREEGFPLALDVGAGPGYLYHAICSEDALDGMGGGGIGGVRKLVQLDSSSFMLHRDEEEENILSEEERERCGTYRLVVDDEEDKMPFPDGTFDLVMSSVALHWINELPTLFSEIKRVLKPDGCFLLAMVGGMTLPELRASLVLGEMEREGGVSPHVGPFVGLSDVGSLLGNAGFTLPTVDVDTVPIAYPNAMVLMEHLQRMGEANACINRRTRTSLDTFLAAAAVYEQIYGIEEEEGGGGRQIEASVQVIYAIGWSPHESQQQPLQRGTATHKVGDIVTHTTTTTSSSSDKDNPV